MICKEIGISVRTYRRWLSHGEIHYDKRVGAPKKKSKRKLTEEEENHVIDICNEPRFSSLPPSQIVPKLLDEGKYIASESTFYRVLRKHKQNNHRGREIKRQKRSKPLAFKASIPNKVYTWDITYLPTKILGKYFYLYTFMDIYSRKIVGYEVHTRESGDLAKLLLDRILRVEDCVLTPPIIHSDNGAPMTSATLNARMKELGITTSFSRSHVSNDNPYSESLFRTLKYIPSWPNKGFTEIASARNWVERFVHWYNFEHQHSQIRFVTPNQRHNGEDTQVLSQRKKVLEKARRIYPERFPNGTRNCNPVGDVWLNPDRDDAGKIIDLGQALNELEKIA